MVKLTKSQARALAILASHGPLTPKRFAVYMWPDSPGWNHHSKCGAYGSHRGGGMYLAAGGFLGRLREAGLTDDVFEGVQKHRISALGREALAALGGKS